MYDAMLQCIAVKFPVREDTFRIRKYGRGRRNIIVRAGRMLKQFGIEVNETLVFKDIEVVMEDNVPMLVLDMKNAEKINRRKHAENP